MTEIPIETFRMKMPIDAHVHLRDGLALSRTVTDTARQFSSAIVMPNLVPPVRTAKEAMAYRERIFAAVVDGSSSHKTMDVFPDFDPRMALYLTDETTPEDVEEAVASGIVASYKLYPAGATTNSASGAGELLSVLKEPGEFDL